MRLQTLTATVIKYDLIPKKENLMIDYRKIYRFTPVEPVPAKLPTGGDIYYECLDCDAVLNSVPHINTACVCGNLAGGNGAVKIKDPARVRALKGKLK